MAALSITAASVTPAAGASKGSGTAGATITAGQIIYAKTDDQGRYRPALANAEATSIMAGVALNGASTGQPVDFIKDGALNPGATVAIGTIYCLSATATGGIVTATHVASTHYVTVMGVATATNKILLHILNSRKAKA